MSGADRNLYKFYTFTLYTHEERMMIIVYLKNYPS